MSEAAESNFSAEMPSAPVMTGENAPTTPATNGEAKKRAYKLQKDLAKYDGKVAITVLGGKKGEMVFNPADLPENVLKQLPAFGLGHKLGDAAAGLSGVEAETAIEKVWEGLLKGDWATRAPASPKVSLAELTSNFSNLSDEEKAAALPLLKALGMKIPGLTD